MSDEAATMGVDEEPIEGEPKHDESFSDEEIARRDSALAAVRSFGDPVLRSRASEVTEFSSELERDSERMINLMHDAMGVGLAATQLGVLRRMLVFQAGPDATAVALVNPVIEWSSEDDLAIAAEGCLSLPRIVVDVERPVHVRVSGADVHGEQILIEA